MRSFFTFDLDAPSFPYERVQFSTPATFNIGSNKPAHADVAGEAADITWLNSIDRRRKDRGDG
jgi:hypothetical protein